MMHRFLACFLFVALSLSVYTPDAHAGTYNAASCSQPDVQSAVNAASDGDIITVPGGNCSWTSTLTIAKSVSIIGAGIGKTVITDNVSGNNMIAIGNGWAAINPRVSGMTINGSAGKSGFKAMIQAGGASASLGFRIDHIRFHNPANIGVVTWDWVWGVIDNCTFDSGGNWALLFNNDSWGGSSYRYGDKAWNDPDDFGTHKFVFVEDCIFNNSAGYTVNYADSYGGARYVLRYNTFNNGFLRAHGTDSTPGRRGTRAVEIYNNQFVNNLTHIAEALEFRSGTALFYNNKASGSGGVDWGIALKCFRDNGNIWATWGRCDGTSYYDQNSSGANGYACLDQPGRGQGDLMASGNDPQPHKWPNQALSAVYIWGNTGFNYGPTSSSSTRIQKSRDYYVDIQKPGYAPYTYPHPLAGAGTVRPNRPANLRAN